MRYREETTLTAEGMDSLMVLCKTVTSARPISKQHLGMVQQRRLLIGSVSFSLQAKSGHLQDIQGKGIKLHSVCLEDMGGGGSNPHLVFAG